VYHPGSQACCAESQRSEAVVITHANERAKNLVLAAICRIAFSTCASVRPGGRFRGRSRRIWAGTASADQRVKVRVAEVSRFASFRPGWANVAPGEFRLGIGPGGRGRCSTPRHRRAACSSDDLIDSAVTAIRKSTGSRAKASGNARLTTRAGYDLPLKYSLPGVGC